MNIQMIKTLVMKDLTLYFRDRFFALITVLSLVAYAGIYFVMPSSVDETFELAFYADNAPAGLAEALISPEGIAEQDAQGVSLTVFESEDALREAIIDGDFVAGLMFTGDLANDPENASLTLFFPPGLPEETEEAISTLFAQVGFGAAGVEQSVQITQEIIGTDFAGQQIPLRERMIPLFAVLVLLIETLGLASLIAEEVETRTIRALLITPMNIGGLFVSKGIMGVMLAFSQASILMLVTGGLSEQPLLILTTLLLGSVLVTGIAFLIASVARDMMSVISWGVLTIVVLSIPSMTVMFPGVVADWVELIPSYYMVQSIDQASNFGAGWGDLASNLVILTVTGIAVLLIGAAVLRRKLYAS